MSQSPHSILALADNESRMGCYPSLGLSRAQNRSDDSQMQDESVSGPMEVPAEVGAQRKTSSVDEGHITEELSQTIDERPKSDDEPSLEQWQHLHQLGSIKGQKWDQERSRAALDESIDLLSAAVSLCPSSESDRGKVLLDLDNVLHKRYQIEGSDDDLQRCIALLRETLDLPPEGHLPVDRSSSLNNLALALGARYALFGDVADLEEQVRLHQQALALIPDGRPHRSRCLHNLALALGARYELFRDVADLEEQVRVLQQALTLIPEGHPHRSTFLNSLAAALSARYGLFGDVADLEEEVRLYQQALTLRPEGHPHRSRSLHNLALALNTRYGLSGDVADLEEQVRLLQQALALTPEGHPRRSRSLNNLANALSTRYDLFGDVADLEEQVCLHQQALALRPEGHPHRSHSLNNLANALGARYGLFGDVTDLEEQVRLHQQALALRPEGHPHHSGSLNNLAVALGARYGLFGDVADLEEQVRLYQQALSLRPEGHPHRSGSLHNLALALGARYGLFGDVADLEEQVRLLQQALALTPEGHPHRSAFLNSFAAALSARYALFGDVTDLEEQVRLLQQALALTPEGHPQRSGSLNNLANALRTRYELFGDVADVEEQVRLYQQALALLPEGHPDRSASLNNLAAALNTRYALSGKKADLEEEVRLHQQALALTPEGHPGRSMSLNNLANALSTRYALFGDVADLEEEVRLHQQALALHPEGHTHRSSSLNNLANAFYLRYACFGDTMDLDNAISLLQSCSSDVFSPRAVALRCSFRWIEIAEKHEHHSLDDAFKHGVACLRQYLLIGPTAQLQYNALLRESRAASLPIAAAVHFIQKGRVEEAIELLDEGRALLSSELRRFRDALTAEERAGLGEELSTRYLDVCRNLRNLSNAEVRFETFSNSSVVESESKLTDGSGSHSNVAYSELLKEKRLKMEAYANILQQIRQVPGFEDFQRTSRFSKLKHAADGGPVVIINCSERRSDIIIVFSHRTPLLISLDSGFYDMMLDTYDGFLEKIARLESTRDVSGAISGFVGPIAKQLWNKLVRQVVEALQDNGIERGSRIWWCPTSFLTSLPIHAAGKGSEWLIDYYVSSYTPTLSALISARQEDKSQVPSIPRILVVAQTKSSGLKNAEVELKEMQKLPSFQECLDEESATPGTVAAHLPSYNWAQFICHGTAANNPFESHLHLYNGSRLTLNSIIKLHMTDAKFAFLAACHSAAQSRDVNALRDEVLHLAAAMQISGFRSVVGTMWQMEDKDGPRIARKFYKEIFEGECGGEGRHTLAATALWKAVRWLKDGSMAESRKGKEKERVDVDEGAAEGKEKIMRKKKEMPIARWANYIHIGA